jgi:hypothetical protein
MFAAQNFVMLRMKVMLLGAALCVCAGLARAQHTKRLWHTYVAPTAGMMYYVGELKKNSLPDADYMHGFVGIQLAQQYKQFLALQFSVSRGALSGYDSLVSAQRAERGFGFYTRTYDAEVLCKLTLLNRHKKMSVNSKPIIHPRLMAGFGLLYFNPMVEHQGEWVDLRALGTSGQHLGLPGYPSPYARLAVGLKFGGEVNVQTGPRTGVNFYGYYTFAQTDYLDDVGSERYVDVNDLAMSDDPALLREFAYPRNQEWLETPGGRRGNPDSNDGYFNLGFSICYRLSEPSRGHY